jgi:hypothetical protein
MAPSSSFLIVSSTKFYNLHLTKFLHIPGDQNTRKQYPCKKTGDCGEGTCDENVCKCTEGWTDFDGKKYDGKPCSYEMKSKWTAFIYSFFLGLFGADYFYLARGSGLYIVAGIFKLLTLGLVGVWWIIGKH